MAIIEESKRLKRNLKVAQEKQDTLKYEASSLSYLTNTSLFNYIFNIAHIYDASFSNSITQRCNASSL